MFILGLFFEREESGIQGQVYQWNQIEQIKSDSNADESRSQYILRNVEEAPEVQRACFSNTQPAQNRYRKVGHKLYQNANEHDGDNSRPYVKNCQVCIGKTDRNSQVNKRI